MSLPIEEYALIGDCQTGALVGRHGSIDWLCFPTFSSDACFAALLGNTDNGHWLLAPAGEIRKTTRRYRGDTLILETEFETDTGRVALIDFMPPRQVRPDLVRIVEGRGGTVAMQMQLVIRFGYGQIVPWVRRDDGGIVAVAGPNALRLDSAMPTHGEDLHTCAQFEVRAGERFPFTLTWFRSHQPIPGHLDAFEALTETESWWKMWTDQCTYQGEYRDAVLRSLITLKALTFQPTGGVIAALTTSLPEALGGVRNWDYRYCWLRDATFTLYALLESGFQAEAEAWRDWLVRAVAGDPAQIQPLYGLAGERRLTEYEIPWLAGYENSRPVRIGNTASEQMQLDVYGEVLDVLHSTRTHGSHPHDYAWRVERALLKHLAEIWTEPDEGIWEIRAERRHFTHSKVMCWVAFDRAIKDAEQFGFEGPVDQWRKLRDQIHQQVCAQGFDPQLNSFVQTYGSHDLDASLLMLPLVGFLPPTDPRIRGTIDAVQEHLVYDGFVHRYDSRSEVDGLPPGEGVFLLCSFWLADNLELIGREAEARDLFERLLGLRNDVGLLSEECDPRTGRLLGNFPQAFSHVALVNTAANLSRPPGPSDKRSR